MGRTVFNEAQQHLLQMMSFVKTNEDLDDMKEAMTSYYASKVDEGMDALIASGGIAREAIEGWGEEHMRTPYKCFL